MGERQVFQEVGQQEQRPGGINRNKERGSYVSGGRAGNVAGEAPETLGATSWSWSVFRSRESLKG